MTDQAAEDRARQEDLAGAARALKKEVADLRGEVKSLNLRTQRAERATFRAALWLAGVALVAVGCGIVGYQNWQTSQQLGAVVADQKRQNEQVWCPFYSLILGGYDPGSRALNPDGTYEGSPRQRYIDGFEGPHGLRAQYAQLRCTSGLIPPRTGG